MRIVSSAVLIAAAAGCAATRPTIRGILSFDEAEAVRSNLGPASSPTPAAGPHLCRCGTFLEERDLQALQSPRTPWEWSPIAPGRTVNPTVRQKHYFLAGNVTDAFLSDNDYEFSHPFGYDLDIDLIVDPAFRHLVWRGDALASSVINIEIEQGLFPRTRTDGG